jgi:hypothetical protein
MKSAFYLIFAAMTLSCVVDVFPSSNIYQDNLISCERNQEQSPIDSKSDRSGA